MEEFVHEFVRKSNQSHEDKNEAFKKGVKLKNINLMPLDDMELIAATFIENEIHNLIPCISKKGENYEELIKENEKLQNKDPKESSQEYLRRLLNASLEGLRRRGKELTKQFSNLGKKWQDSLIKNSKEIDSLGMHINDIRSYKIPPLPTIENPAHETNARLSNISSQLDKLTLLTDSEIKQAELLNEKTTSLIEAASESGQQAKRSLYVATVAIIISVIMSFLSSIKSNESAVISNDILKQLLYTEQTNSKNMASRHSDIVLLFKQHHAELNQSIINSEANKLKAIQSISSYLYSVDKK